MKDGWYYEEDEQTVGPVSHERLVRTLSARPNPSQIMIWAAGFSAWRTAGSVPEVAAWIGEPPPLSTRRRSIPPQPRRSMYVEAPNPGRIVRTERRKRGFFGWLFLLVFLLFNGLMVTWLISYWSAVLPLNSVGSEASRVGAAIGTTLGTGFIFSIWACGSIVLGLFVLFTRGRKVIIETMEASKVTNRWKKTFAGLAIFAILIFVLLATIRGPTTRPVGVEAHVAASTPDRVISAPADSIASVQPRAACKVSLAQYTRLATTMSYPRITAILGCAGIEMSRVEMGGQTAIMYSWEGNGFAANMNVMLQNGALVSKAQIGLQ